MRSSETSKAWREGIQVETVILLADEGRQFEACIARPETGRGPGILICTEMWGVTPAKCEMAAAYARRGFCAIVPNFFWRSDPSGVVGDSGADRDVAWERLREFDFDVATRDIGLAIQWLRQSSACTGRVASIGFCMGGRLALLAGIRHDLDVAISLYALGIAHHLSELQSASCRMQLHYGSADKHIPLTEIEQVQGATCGRENIEVWLYPGIGHGFFNPDREAYDAAAVALATDRMNRLLDGLA